MNKRKIATIIAACALGVCVLVGYAQPGTESDPVVTLSYINETVLPQVYEYVENLFSKAPAKEGTAVSDDLKFAVAEVPAGKKIICDASCEIILRAGTAKIIATEKGGIADTTAGVDLANGTEAPKNHLLIVPVDDGRGFETASDCILMIKGEYSIK